MSRSMRDGRSIWQVEHLGCKWFFRVWNIYSRSRQVLECARNMYLMSRGASMVENWPVNDQVAHLAEVTPRRHWPVVDLSLVNQVSLDPILLRLILKRFSLYWLQFDLISTLRTWQSRRRDFALSAYMVSVSSSILRWATPPIWFSKDYK